MDAFIFTDCISAIDIVNDNCYEYRDASFDAGQTGYRKVYELASYYKVDGYYFGYSYFHNSEVCA